jgi:ribosomal protein S18 acetylase RimI-like enzyme
MEKFEEFKFYQVLKPEELNILANYSSSYDKLNFNYSQKYISQLKDSLSFTNAYQVFIVDGKDNFAGYIASFSGLDPFFSSQFISELFVNQDFRGKGLATILLNKVLEFAKQKNLNSIITQTELENLPAQKLYEKFGFKRIVVPKFEEYISYELQL